MLPLTRGSDGLFQVAARIGALGRVADVKIRIKEWRIRFEKGKSEKGGTDSPS